MGCDSCEMVTINGIPCHEHGCQDAWKDKPRACFQCGFDFQPETRHASICEDCRCDNMAEGDNP